MDELFEKELDALDEPKERPYLTQSLEETYFIDTAIATMALVIVSGLSALASTLYSIQENPITVFCLLSLSLGCAYMSGWCVRSLKAYDEKFKKETTNSLWDRIKVSYEPQPKRRSHKVVRKKGVTLYG